MILPGWIKLFPIGFGLLTSITAFAGVGNFLFSPLPSLIPPYTWIGLGGNSNWNNTANWSTGAVPGAGNVAIFDDSCSGSNCNVTVNVNPGVQGINMKATYTGTITQSAGVALSLGTSGWTQAAGTFAGGASAITLSGSFNLSGGTFTSTSGTMTFLNSDLNFTGGTFAHGSGTVILDRVSSCASLSATINAPSGISFWNLNYAASTGCSPAYTLSITAGQTVTVLNDFSMLSSGNGTIYANGGTIDVKGNVTGGAGATGGTTSLRVTGAAASHTYTYSGGILPAITFDDTGGTLTAAGGTTALGVLGLAIANGTFTAPTGTLTIWGESFALTGGTFTHNSGTVAFDRISSCGSVTATINVPLGVNFWNLNYTSGTGCGPGYFLNLTAGQTLTVLNDFTMAATGNGAIYANGGTIDVKRHVTGGTGAGAGTSVLAFTGTNAQTMTLSAGALPGTVTVNKASNTVTLASAWTSVGAMAVTQGTVNMQGYDLSVTGLTMSAGTITRQGGAGAPGVLRINSAIQGTGAYQGGTISD